VPAGCVAGDAYRTDAETMTGYFAVCPAGSDDAKMPASAFAPRQALVVRVIQAEGRLQAIAADLQPRGNVPRGIATPTTVDNDGKDRDYARLDRELLDGAATPPPGTEPCQLGAWSEDRDPTRLNVRAEPGKARVLGTLPPHVDAGGRRPRGSALIHLSRRRPEADPRLPRLLGAGRELDGVTAGGGGCAPTRSRTAAGIGTRTTIVEKAAPAAVTRWCSACHARHLRRVSHG
jgi:hypothetical protein